jgi:hypothetical protein
VVRYVGGAAILLAVAAGGYALLRSDPPAPPPPVAKVAASPDLVLLQGLRRLWVGPKSLQHTARARWCYLDVEIDDGAIYATVSRPDLGDAELTCERATLDPQGRLEIVIFRSVLVDDQEIRETWKLSGRWANTSPTSGSFQGMATVESHFEQAEFEEDGVLEEAAPALRQRWQSEPVEDDEPDALLEAEELEIEAQKKAAAGPDFPDHPEIEGE